MARARYRILALAPYPERAPSTRVRVSQFGEGLAELGFQLTLHPFVDEGAYQAVRRGGPGAVLAAVGAFRRLRRTLANAGSYDAVLIQRGIGLLGDLPLLRVLQEQGTPLVYDFDDAVFLPQEGGRWWIESLRGPAGSTRAFCRAARVVLAGNAYLADFARNAVGPGRSGDVRVLPSAVDTRRLVPGGRREGTPTLGWVGSDSTMPYLESLAPALRELAGRVPFRMVVAAGERPPLLPGVDVHSVPWSVAGELATFQSIDVGLYPVDDSPWSRGKCGFKALQYLSCGVPCVASPVGVLRDIVRPGVTGLHATTSKEWVDACVRLLADPAARERMGANGRAMVKASYSVEAVLPGLVDALVTTVDGGHA